jgi:hypothetical protein
MEAVIYVVFLGFVLYMVYKFLIKLNFYREWHLTAFYTVAVLILVLRIINFILNIVGWEHGLGFAGSIIMNGFDSTNTYLKVVLGLV